jgi:hypothetical protein
MKYRGPFSAKYLRSILHYSPKTGQWTWLVVRRQQHFTSMKAGYKNRFGYWLIGIDGYSYQSSRLAWLYMTGRWPRETIDHKDRNPGNNKWSNLREASSALQNSNKTNNRSHLDLHKSLKRLFA